MKPTTKLLIASLATALALATAPALADPAQNGEWHTAESLLGAPRYAEGFTKFDYVNVDAPKGGLVRLSSHGRLRHLQPDPARGRAGRWARAHLRDADRPRPRRHQCLHTATSPRPGPIRADISSVTFRMNPRAKWQDGQPITAEDVKWSFEQQIAVNPNMQQYYQDVDQGRDHRAGRGDLHLR